MIIVVNSRQFGINLEKARKAKKLSRWKLASMVGLKWRELYRLEKGIDRKIELMVLYDLCSSLHKEMEEIINNQNNNAQIDTE